MIDKDKNPFRGFTDLNSELNRMRQLGRREESGQGEIRERDHANAWMPTADVFARGDDLVIRIELSGMDPEDVDLTLSRDVLTVSGERRTQDGADDSTFYVRERYFGAFRRSMNLPEGTNESAISAEFENGLVEITVQGAAASSGPHRIALRNKSGGPETRTLR